MPKAQNQVNFSRGYKKKSKRGKVTAPASSCVVKTERADACSAAPLVAEDSSADTQSLIGTDGDLTWTRPPDYHTWTEASKGLADAVARRNAELDRLYPPLKR